MSVASIRKRSSIGSNCWLRRVTAPTGSQWRSGHVNAEPDSPKPVGDPISSAQCCLQRLQLTEPIGELVADPGLLGVGDIFLGVLDLADQQVAVEVLKRHRHVSE